MTKLHFSTLLPLPVEEAYAFGTTFSNLSKVQPGYVKILKGEETHALGNHFILLFWQGLLPTLWWGKISDLQPNSHFTDIQIFGPFKSWKHTHWFKRHPQGTLMEDEIEYELWGGPFARWLDRTYVKPLLEKMYQGRQKKALEAIHR